MATKQISPVAEFVKLGYGDSYDLPVRCLDFRTEGIGDFATMAECLTVIGGYNRFDPARVIAALEPIFGSLSSVQVGRESSVVIYATVPHWSHQRSDSTNCGMGEAYTAPMMQSIAVNFAYAMGEAYADEISVVRPDGHGFWRTVEDSTGPRCVGGNGVFTEDEKPHRIRAWWD